MNIDDFNSQIGWTVENPLVLLLAWRLKQDPAGIYWLSLIFGSLVRHTFHVHRMMGLCEHKFNKKYYGNNQIMSFISS